MIVERKNNEILVRFSASANAAKIQSILDYLRYEEITSTSKATQADLDILLKNVKKGRLKKIRKELGFEE